MRNEMTLKEIGGVKVMKVRGMMKAPKVFRDFNRYNRKTKHKKGWAE